VEALQEARTALGAGRKLSALRLIGVWVAVVAAQPLCILRPKACKAWGSNMFASRHAAVSWPAPRARPGSIIGTLEMEQRQGVQRICHSQLRSAWMEQKAPFLSFESAAARVSRLHLETPSLTQVQLVRHVQLCNLTYQVQLIRQVQLRNLTYQVQPRHSVP